MSLLTDKVTGGYRHDILNVDEDSPLEFKISFGSFEPLTRQDISAIHKWLRKNEYEKLEIVQPDMKGLHYNCILHDSEIKQIGNVPYAFEYTVTCDSPFAWEDVKTYNYRTITDSKVMHFNDSDIPTYLRPVVRFKSLVADNNVSIENVNNDGWVTAMVGLGKDEIVTIDSENEMISTDRRGDILSSFNHGWFELVQGVNELNIIGSISELGIVYANARRIGA